MNERRRAESAGGRHRGLLFLLLFRCSRALSRTVLRSAWADMTRCSWFWARAYIHVVTLSIYMHTCIYVSVYISIHNNYAIAVGIPWVSRSLYLPPAAPSSPSVSVHGFPANSCM